jgi:hypothetical protein
MGISRKSRQKVLWIVALLVVLLFVSGCGGIKPYEPRNNREEGPQKGLFTGSQGEFVIMRKAEEPQKGSEDKQSPNEPENTGPPEQAIDESGSVNKSSGDTP